MEAHSPGHRYAGKRQRLILVIAGLALLGVSAAIALTALKDNLVFFYTPSMLLERPVSPGENFRLGGLVERGSVARQEENAVSFTVSDGGERIQVVYRGILPNLFREGQGVVAEGAMRGDGVFLARTVLAKHDENYMPPAMSDALKQKGLWHRPAGNGAAQ